MARWASRKGIDLLGTGDVIHPEWLDSIGRCLSPADESGIYELAGVRFLLTGEISLVWRQDGRGRRIHLVLLIPSIHDAKRVSDELSKRGNITSDGRPILGLSACDALETIWNAAPETVVIPAHVWTPWYSVFGAKSGFDSLEACFGAHAGRIRAIETGLSSDPAMIRRWSALDDLQLVSCSDAHSLSKLGREATVFDLAEASFAAIADALATGKGHAGTIEYHPEMGKYHHDGHRACGVEWMPSETRAHDGICPVCGRAVTIGVLHRVEELCDRARPAGNDVVRYIVPLDEILAWVHGVGTNTVRVRATADALISRFDTELDVLLHVPEQELRDASDPEIASAIQTVRQGDIRVRPGYDGVYGRLEVAS